MAFKMFSDWTECMMLTRKVMGVQFRQAEQSGKERPEKQDDPLVR
jgi:hypothetical protein